MGREEGQNPRIGSLQWEKVWAKTGRRGEIPLTNESFRSRFLAQAAVFSE